jgi:hypothetical protein
MNWPSTPRYCERNSEFRDPYRTVARIAANIAKLPELAQAVRHQKLPAAFPGPARGILRAMALNEKARLTGR